MSSEWIGALNAIALDKAVGNTLAGLIDPDSGGSATFDKGLKLRPIGSADTEPTAWAASSPLKQSGIDYCSEFTGTGPYPLLNALGMSDANVEAAQPAMLIEFGPREQYEGTLLAFIAANGYEIIPAA